MHAHDDHLYTKDSHKVGSLMENVQVHAEGLVVLCMVVFGSHTVHRQTRNLKPVAIYVLHVI